jgi:hypothetical protein
MSSFNMCREVKVMFRLFGAIIMLAFLAGCGTTKMQKAANEHDARQMELVEQTIADAPKWYTKVPESSPNFMFIAGTGSSRNLTLARDKAVLDAEKQLANQIDALVSSRMKEYVREVGANSPITISDNESVTKKLILEANIAGYAMNKTIVVPEGKHYRWYVLLEYPVGEANVLRTIKETEKQLRVFSTDKNKAFEELQLEIDADRATNNEVTVGQVEKQFANE